MFKSTLTAFILTLTATTALAEQFTIATLGDTAYGKPEEVYPQYEKLISTINDLKPDLVIHVGDTKSGSTHCSDEMLAAQLAYLNSFEAPLLYSPGDNEWTDCHRKAAGEFKPLERLARIRTTYFTDATKSFGKAKVDVTSQAADGYPENARMTHKGVLFITAHVPGSNNNFEIRDPEAVAEFFARDKANIKWINDSFAAAGDAKAIVIGMQANMFEADWNTAGDETWMRHSGFMNVGNAIMENAAKFGKPVLLVYGDSHTYSSGRPFPTKAPNVISLQVPGEKQMHAVSVTIDTETTGVFSTSIIMNPDLAGSQ
jgi:Calcineurin-like phosphoesterase